MGNYGCHYGDEPSEGDYIVTYNYNPSRAAVTHSHTMGTIVRYLQKGNVTDLTLQFHELPVNDRTLLFEALPKCTLQGLKLQYEKLTATEIGHLVKALKKNKTIQCLTLCGRGSYHDSGLTSYELRVLALLLRGNRTLRILRVTGSRILSDNAIPLVEALLRDPENALHTLDLSNNLIDGSGLKAFEKFLDHTPLKKLILCNISRGISNDDIRSFAEFFRRSKTLEKVDMDAPWFFTGTIRRKHRKKTLYVMLMALKEKGNNPLKAFLLSDGDGAMLDRIATYCWKIPKWMF